MVISIPPDESKLKLTNHRQRIRDEFTTRDHIRIDMTRDVIPVPVVPIAQHNAASPNPAVDTSVATTSATAGSSAAGAAAATKQPASPNKNKDTKEDVKDSNGERNHPTGKHVAVLPSTLTTTAATTTTGMSAAAPAGRQGGVVLNDTGTGEVEMEFIHTRNNLISPEDKILALYECNFMLHRIMHPGNLVYDQNSKSFVCNVSPFGPE